MQNQIIIRFSRIFYYSFYSLILVTRIISRDRSLFKPRVGGGGGAGCGRGWRKLRGALKFFWSDEGEEGASRKDFLFEVTPFIYRITDLHLLQMLEYQLSLGLFTIILVNNVTFCQTKRYKYIMDVNPCIRDISL